MTLQKAWPLPALVAWGACWAAFLGMRGLAAPVLLATSLGAALGALLSVAGHTRWRRLFIALGFPLSLAASGLAGGLPAWAWLLPLGLLALVYPLNAWRDAPVFPTPAGALGGLARTVSLPSEPRILDAGCGLGDGLRELRREFPEAQLDGLEWSWPLRWLCAWRRRDARVRRGDLWAADWSDYDLVYLFQRPESMDGALAKARRELRPGAWLASLEFAASSLSATGSIDAGGGRRVWLYRMPEPVDVAGHGASRRSRQVARDVARSAPAGSSRTSRRRKHVAGCRRSRSMTMDKRMNGPSLAAATVLAVALGSLSPAARAGLPVGDYLTVGGFGTIGGVATNSDEGQYGRDRQTGGAKKSPALDVDSNLGVQLDAKATDWLSGTVQVLSAKREDLGFKARIEWAYVLVKPLDGLSIRGGRMATPAFLVSDSRNIGYANNWARPPNEVYALNVFHNFDGGDITYRRAFGAVAVSVNALAGKTRFRPLNQDATGDDLRGLNLQIDTDWVTLRAGRVKAKVSVPVFSTLDDPYSFTGYGFTVDPGNIFVQAEFVQRRSGKQGVGVDSNGWYAMGGYRFGPVLPYLIVSRTAPKVAASPFHLTGTQRTTALGVRWDAFKSADLKFQVDRIDTSGTAGASFTTPLVPLPIPGPPARAGVNGVVTAFSLALDFTF